MVQKATIRRVTRCDKSSTPTHPHIQAKPLPNRPAIQLHPEPVNVCEPSFVSFTPKTGRGLARVSVTDVAGELGLLSVKIGE